jgi:hypothetical protein
MAKNLEPVSGVLSTATYPNRFNVVIPIEAPFYRTGLVITAPGRPEPLIEGLDYYLGYYYQEAAEAFKEAVYGGIILLHATQVDYEIVPIGREYRIPSSEIAKWLVKDDIKDPRNVDWSTLMRFAPTIPAIDPPQSLEEAILRDEVVAALHELTTVLKDQAAQMEGAYDDCAQVLTRAGKKIYEDGLYQHHLKPNTHPYTGNNLAGPGVNDVKGTGTYLRGDGAWVETYSVDELTTLLNGGTVPPSQLVAGDNCLMVAGRAVDATLAFGRTFQQLLDVMSTAGIQQRDIDALMGLTLGELYGRLSVENNNTLTYKTANDNHLIEFNGGSILLRTKLRMELAGDRDNNEPGVGVEVGAGLNTLLVHSGPDAVAPVYNGVFLITPEQVKLYIHSLILQTANAYFLPTSTLDIVGTGKQVAPVMMTAKPPTASDTVEGLFALSNVPTPAPLPGVALSQAGVTQVRDDLDSYVDDTFTINGKAFNKTTQNIDLTKADFQLSNVQNTAVSAKPVSTALAAALALKALLGHAHTMADLVNVPTASGTVPGMMQLHDVVDATTDKAVTAKQGYLIDQKIQTSEDKAQVLLPAWAVVGSQYGKPGFMPIPAMGNYEGFAKNGAEPLTAFGVQEGVLYGIRSGHSGDLNYRLFYCAAAMNSDGTLNEMNVTSTRYVPAGMVNFPGVELTAVAIAGTGGFLATGSDGKYYLVLFDGYMDYRRHNRVFQVMFEDYSADNVLPYAHDNKHDFLVIANNNVYVGRNHMTERQYRIGLYRATIPVTGTSMHFQQQDLQFARKVGKCADITEPGPYEVDNPTTQRLLTVTAAGKAKWNSIIEVRRGISPFTVPAVMDNVLRIGSNPVMYAESFTVGVNLPQRTWRVHVDINLQTMTVTPPAAGTLPLRLDENNFYYQDGSAAATTWYFPFHASGYTFNGVIELGLNDVTKRYNVAFFSSYDNPGAFPYVKTGEMDVPFFDVVGARRFVPSLGLANIKPSYGSAYISGMFQPVLFPRGVDEVWVTDSASKLSVASRFDRDGTFMVPGWGGFGPTNDRRGVAFDDYADIADIPFVDTPNYPNGALDGAFFFEPETKRCKTVPSTTSLAVDVLSIDQVNWDKMKASILALNETTADNGFASLRFAEAIAAGNGNGEQITWGLTVFGTKMSGGALFVVTVNCVSAEGISTYHNVYNYVVDGRIDAAGKITIGAGAAQQIDFKLKVMSKAKNVVKDPFPGKGRGRRLGQMSLLSEDGVNYYLMITNTCGMAVSGGTYGFGMGTALTKNGSVWTGKCNYFMTQHDLFSPRFIFWVPELRRLVNGEFVPDAAFCSGLGRTISQAIAGTAPTEQLIIAGVRLAEGWIMYITEEVYLYVKHHAITVPQFELDLSVAFAGNCANKTFHVHVEGYEETGIWKGRYVVGFTKLPDTDARLYVGYVVTDSSRIVQMDLRRVKRLGRVRALLEHALDATRHENSSKLAKQFSPLGITQAAPLDVQAPEVSYLSQVGSAKRLGARGGIVTIPAPIGIKDWSMSPVEKFWKRAEVLPLPATAAQEAKDLGMVAVSFGSGKLQAGEFFGVKVNFTNTKGIVRMKSVADDHLTVSIDGVVVNPTAGGYVAMKTLDFNVAPGQHTLALNVGEGPGFSPVYVAFILYDWDGTTERELLRSGASSTVGITLPVLARHKSGCVLRAHQITVDATTTVLGVTDVATGLGVPFVTEVNGPTQTVYYATEWYPDGSATKRTLSANDAVINLMIAPSI